MSRSIRIATTDGFELSAYKCAPAGSPRAGLVVLQEIFGLNQHIRHVADTFAEAGFLTVAPALFDRVERDVELDYDQIAVGRDLMSRLDEKQTLLDLTASIAVVADAGKVLVVGYCWGGTLAYQVACRFPVAAAASTTGAAS
jgi:carboxymethylenebutenolidase